jgi:hypothetical protein
VSVSSIQPKLAKAAGNIPAVPTEIQSYKILVNKKTVTRGHGEGRNIKPRLKNLTKV